MQKLETNMTQSNSRSPVALSDRELQVVELVASGLTNQEIAEKLEISKRTVDNHISNILTKTATDNRVALVRWALQWGRFVWIILTVVLYRLLLLTMKLNQLFLLQ